MFKKNPYLWGALICLLAALNLWKWLPSLGPKVESKLRAGVSKGLALQFPAALGENETAVHRDLFAFGPHPSAHHGVSPAIGPVKKAPTPAVTYTLTPPAPGSPVMEISGGYRLMGVVSREGRSQALIGKGDQLFQVVPGDEIEGHYKVGSIGENEVYLTEERTGNTLKLHIWDQQGAKP